MSMSYGDVLCYGRHSPLGRTLDVPEERDPGHYHGEHRPCMCGHLKYLAPKKDKTAGRYYSMRCLPNFLI